MLKGIIQTKIKFALKLDSTLLPRISRSQPHLPITIHYRNRTMILFTVKRWGLEDPLFPYAKNNHICRAAATQVAYDHGYMKPLSCTQIPAWNDSINKLIDGGSDGFSCLLSSNHISSIEYVQQIKTNFPGYLHTLYRYSSKTFGCKASFGSLALSMNEKNATQGERKMNILLGKTQLKIGLLQITEKSTLLKKTNMG